MSDREQILATACWKASSAGSTSRVLVNAQRALRSEGIEATPDEIWRAFRSSEWWPRSAPGQFEAMMIAEGSCGGRPRIRGTEVSVASIIGLHRSGASDEEVAAKLGITLSQVRSAREYFRWNQALIPSPQLLQQHDEVMSGEKRTVEFSVGTPEELLNLAADLRNHG